MSLQLAPVPPRVRGMRNAVLVAAFIFFSASVGAFELYGLKLGERLELPECARLPMPAMPNFTPPYATISAPCLKSDSSGRSGRIAFPASQPPQHAVGAHLGFRVDSSGRLAVMTLMTAGVPAQSDVMRDLVAKFGEPQHRVDEPITTVGGAALTSTRAFWVRQDLRIEFIGATNRADAGELVVGTPAGVDDYRKAQGAAIAGRPM